MLVIQLSSTDKIACSSSWLDRTSSTSGSSRVLLWFFLWFSLHCIQVLLIKQEIWWTETKQNCPEPAWAMRLCFKQRLLWHTGQSWWPTRQGFHQLTHWFCFISYSQRCYNVFLLCKDFNKYLWLTHENTPRFEIHRQPDRRQILEKMPINSQLAEVHLSIPVSDSVWTSSHFWQCWHSCDVGLGEESVEFGSRPCCVTQSTLHKE